MNLFHDKSLNEPELKPGYAYSAPGWYHITICTKFRVHYFGNIVPSVMPDPDLSAGTLPETMVRMILSEAGQIAEKYWNEIPGHFSRVVLDAYQLMPNHFHGIMQITDAPGSDVYTREKHSQPELGNIIYQFKRICSIKTQESGLELIWQSRFHNHLIQGDSDLQRVRKYIRNNPKNWVHDKYNI